MFVGLGIITWKSKQVNMKRSNKTASSHANGECAHRVVPVVDVYENEKDVNTIGDDIRWKSSGTMTDSSSSSSEEVPAAGCSSSPKKGSSSDTSPLDDMILLTLADKEAHHDTSRYSVESYSPDSIVEDESEQSAWVSLLHKTSHFLRQKRAASRKLVRNLRNQWSS